MTLPLPARARIQRLNGHERTCLIAVAAMAWLIVFGRLGSSSLFDPEDFMFQLTADEEAALRSQIVILKSGRGRHRKHLPYVFTEQGVAMLSSVLNSPRAVQVNIAIMRVFVKIRTLLASHVDLLRRLDEMEERYDEQFRIVFEAIRQLIEEPVLPKNRIGFNVHQE